MCLLFFFKTCTLQKCCVNNYGDYATKVIFCDDYSRTKTKCSTQESFPLGQCHNLIVTNFRYQLFSIFLIIDLYIACLVNLWITAFSQKQVA